MQAPIEDQLAYKPGASVLAACQVVAVVVGGVVVLGLLVGSRLALDHRHRSRPLGPLAHSGMPRIWLQTSVVVTDCIKPT
jgi:hypothetical protein